MIIKGVVCMANNCFYEMKIKGSRESCNKWLQRMKSYDEPSHFYRMFEVYVDDEYGTESEYCMQLSGDCAWSLESCCRASGYSNGIDLFAENTEELNIVMEAYSTEPGIGFQEHYIYNNGQCEAEECVDYTELYWDKDDFPSFDDFKKEYNLEDDISEDDLDEGEYIHQGGFESWEFTI